MPCSRASTEALTHVCIMNGRSQSNYLPFKLMTQARIRNMKSILWFDVHELSSHNMLWGTKYELKIKAIPWSVLFKRLYLQDYSLGKNNSGTCIMMHHALWTCTTSHTATSRDAPLLYSQISSLVLIVIMQKHLFAEGCDHSKQLLHYHNLFYITIPFYKSVPFCDFF